MRPRPAAASTSAHPRRLPLMASPRHTSGCGHHCLDRNVTCQKWPQTPKTRFRRKLLGCLRAVRGTVTAFMMANLARAVSSLRTPGNRAGVSKTSNPSGWQTIAMVTGPFRAGCSGQPRSAKATTDPRCRDTGCGSWLAGSDRGRSPGIGAVRGGQLRGRPPGLGEPATLTRRSLHLRPSADQGKGPGSHGRDAPARRAIVRQDHL
jgi:hypothetical protein